MRKFVQIVLMVSIIILTGCTTHKPAIKDLHVAGFESGFPTTVYLPEGRNLRGLPVLVRVQYPTGARWWSLGNNPRLGEFHPAEIAKPKLSPDYFPIDSEVFGAIYRRKGLVAQ